MPIEGKKAMPNLHRFAQTEVKERQDDVVHASKRISAKQRVVDRNKWSSKQLLYRFTPVLSLSRARIVSVSAGHHHTLLIDEAGQVLAFGEGSHGQLGQGTCANLSTPRPIARLSPAALGEGHEVVALAAGMTFSVALTASGVIYTWGSGPYGELGRGKSAIKALEPERVKAIPLAIGERGFSSVTCGAHHVMALCAADARTLCVWGRNEFGQLGNGTRQNSFAPETLNRSGTWWKCEVRMISAGDRHSAIVTEAGDLWCWGRGRHGQLCQPTRARDADTVDVVVPTVLDTLRGKTVLQATCGARHTGVLTSDGLVSLYGGVAYTRGDQGVKLDFAGAGAGTIAEIRSGGSHLFARDAEGRAFVVVCETQANLLQRDAPLFSRKLPGPVSAQGDLLSEPLRVLRVREPAEEAAYLDQLVDDMLISVDENGVSQCNDAHEAWDAAQLVSTGLVETLRDGIRQPVETLLFSGKSPYFAPGELPERAQSPGSAARRAREYSEAFQNQYKKSIPPVLVRRKTQYLGRDVGFREVSTFERYRKILAKHAAEWGDLLEEQGWAREVESGNYIPYKVLYDIQAFGRRLEDDNSILEMRRIFFYFDKDASGEIDAYEMCVAMQQLGYSVSVRRVKRIIRKYDTNGNGTINLEEFLDFCYAEIIRKGRNVGWLRRLLNRRQVVAKTDPPPAVPPKLPPAKLRREERERMLWFKYRRRLRAPGRVFADTYSRFVRAFMRECVEAGTWGTIPARLRRQLCVPNSQPLFHIGEIDLSECDVTDAHVDALCTALKCAPVVRRIDLRHNHITKVGADLLKDVLLHHDELAEYIDCAKCLACGDMIPFDDPRDPRTPSASCGCSPGSRGGRLYQLPVYWLEHVVVEDPMTKPQRLASHKVGLALELDAFAARALNKRLSMRTFLKGHIPDPREDDPVADADAQPTKTFKEVDLEAWIKKRVARAQVDLEKALTQHVDHEVKMREIRRVFVEADKDGSGYLDRKELRTCFAHLGLDRKLAKTVFDEIDKDGNGFVTLDELEQCAEMLASRSDVRLLGRKRKNAASEADLQREKEEIEALSKDLGVFGMMLWEKFHMPQYRAHANGRLQNVTLALKRKVFNACREAFHSSGPPVREDTILSMVDAEKTKCWEDLRRSFPWTAENLTWSECEAAVLGFTDLLKTHYLALNRQIRVVQLAPGLRHALVLTERRIPWVRGFQDDGKQEALQLWNERIVQGIQSLEPVLAD